MWKTQLKRIEEEFWKFFNPPPLMTVSEWAEKNRFIPPHKSVEPGRWKNSRTPYLVSIMDFFNDPNTEKIVFCSATQVGKTQTILNQLGYLIDYDPDPAMIVYPTEDTGKSIFRDYLDPMIRACPSLNDKIPDSSDDYTISRMVFKGGAEIFLAWANSPASLASKPIRYLFLDEVDKYPTNVGKEANPIELAMERTSTFWNRKIVIVSTPTVETAPIWQELKHADVVFYFYVPCPHCGHYQKLIFEQVKWENKEGTYAEAERTAYYECEKCKKAIKDHHKPSMLLKGKWKAEKKVKYYKSVAFHLSGLYSPWRTFGQFARKFLETKKYPERLQNFVNSWLAEPWRDDTAKLKQEEVIEALKAYAIHKRGIVPSEAVALTAGVDVQEDRFYFVIRAWASDYTSWLVLEGEVPTWEMLKKILFMNRYPTTDGSQMAVELACIDSGYRTQEVYRFVEENYPRAVAVKGASSDMKGRPYSLPSQELRRQLGISAPYLVNTLFFKDFIYMRRGIPPGEPGAWYIYEGVSKEYLQHITSEVRKIRKGRVRWEKRTEHTPNHLWDAEVYAAVAAEILNVPYRSKHTQIAEQNKPQKGRKKRISGWLGDTSGWLE